MSSRVVMTIWILINRNMNYRDFLQRVIYVIINPIIQAMVKVGITPNMVTTIGFVGNLAATSLFVIAALMVRSGDMAQAMEMVGWGGATILFAGLFDMKDGRMGIATYAAILGSVMVSYVRARAEGLGIECKVGLLQRPERVVITALAAIASGATGNLWWLAGGMLVIAVLANLTACWRIAHCHKVLNAGKKQ